MERVVVPLLQARNVPTRKHTLSALRVGSTVGRLASQVGFMPLTGRPCTHQEAAHDS